MPYFSIIVETQGVFILWDQFKIHRLRLYIFRIVLCPFSSRTMNLAYQDAASACTGFNLTTQIGLMHGWGWKSNDSQYHGYSRNTGCGHSCGPAGFFRWDNGPQGFADHAGAGLSTQWPSTLNMAATFDPDLAVRSF